MALNRRKSVLMVVAAIVVAAGLVWAWVDGGERPLAPLSAPAMLPGDVK